MSDTMRDTISPVEPVEPAPPSPVGKGVGGVGFAEPEPERGGNWGIKSIHFARALTAGLPALVTLALLIAVWQWFASRPGADPQVLPTPGAVWHALISQRVLLWKNTVITLRETVVGFAVAFVAGVFFATLIDFSPWLRRAIYPLLISSQTIPIITIAPLVVFWFGFGIVSKSIVVLLVCFFPISVALVDGLRAADPELIKLYRTFGAGRWRLFWSVRLPGALPTLFSGVRIAITYSVVGAIFGEYVGATGGLGWYIEQKQHDFQTQAIIAAVAVTALLSVALFLLTAVIERLALPWYHGQRRGGR